MRLSLSPRHPATSHQRTDFRPLALACLLLAPWAAAMPAPATATVPSAIPEAGTAASAPVSGPASSVQATLAAIAARQADPEAGSGRYPLSTASARQGMAVTAHPMATEAALFMLRLGGSVADAAVAAQAVLGLVEPQSSGFGGGGFLVVAEPAGQTGSTVTAIDGRETAPAAATPERFLDAGGHPLPFDQALASARAVGIPGSVAMLAEAHRRWGRLPWATLLAPAIRLAEYGTPVSHRLHTLSAQDALLAASPTLRPLLLDADGKPWPQGHLLRNPAQARLLRTLAQSGPDAFYRGPLADEMVTALRTAGSDITLADWQGYRALVSPALCHALTAAVRACSAPPPSGGVSVLQNLALWLAASPPGAALYDADRHDLAPAALHRLLEAERLAFADRQQHVGDPAVVPVPTAGLLSPAYLRERAALIGERAAPGPVAAGNPPGAALAAMDRHWREHGTTHVSLVDSDGRWLVMTSSIEDSFGSRLLVNGLLMNNQLTDFSFMPVQDGLPVANRVQPGKRPRSAMSPTLLLDNDGRPLIATGSPGGSRILGFNTRVLAAWLAGVHDAGALASLPHALNRNGATEVERELQHRDPALAAFLRERGHDLKTVAMTSGHGIILRTETGLEAAADPRREGRADGF